jgi:hypothetical protein
LEVDTKEEDLLFSTVYSIVTLKTNWDIPGGLKAVVNELAKRRSEEGHVEIAGDFNFCICRFLVGYTVIHLNPRYSKVNLINRILRRVQNGLRDGHEQHQTAEIADGIIDDVRLELYRRYAAGYEDLKCADPKNGDIME